MALAAAMRGERVIVMAMVPNPGEMDARHSLRAGRTGPDPPNGLGRSFSWLAPLFLRWIGPETRAGAKGKDVPHCRTFFS